VGLRDVIFGRSKTAPPNLDNIFALPSAAITIEANLDLVTSGEAGLCFKAGTGESQIESEDEIKALLGLDQPDTPLSLTTDDLGFKWLIVKNADLGELVTQIHGANSTMVDHGLGGRLLCAVFGFVPKSPPGEGAVRLVYLMKRGTFYPFAPTGPDNRNNELEIRTKSFLETELPIEKDLTRWMALWNLPVN